MFASLQINENNNYKFNRCLIYIYTNTHVLSKGRRKSFFMKKKSKKKEKKIIVNINKLKTNLIQNFQSLLLIKFTKIPKRQKRNIKMKQY